MTENVDFRVKGRRVLIVGEDGESMCRNAKILFEDGYLVTTTLNTVLADEMLSKKGNHDLLIIDRKSIKDVGFLDLILPVTDIPILVLSSDFPAERVLECKVRGVVEVLLKPVDRLVLDKIWQHAANSKKRFKWTDAYKAKFNDALEALKAEGISDINGKKIWEKMDAEGITVETVASHYKWYKKKSELDGTTLPGEKDTADKTVDDGTDRTADDGTDRTADDAIETEGTMNKDGQGDALADHST